MARHGNEQTIDLVSALWRKSSHSGGDEALCVEVAAILAGLVSIRDSKNPTGPALILTPAQWRAFVDNIKKGRITF